MGDSSVEVSEESFDASQEAKAKGMEAISNGLFLSLLLCMQIVVLIYGNHQSCNQTKFDDNFGGLLQIACVLPL